MKSAASTLAAPGSPGRDAKTSLPTLPKVTRSSFLPSSNFASTVSAGVSRPVFAVDSTNEVGAHVRQAARAGRRSCRLSTSAGVRADAPPLVRRVLALALDPLEDDGLAVARDLDAVRVERRGTRRGPCGGSRRRPSSGRRAARSRPSRPPASTRRARRRVLSVALPPMSSVARALPAFRLTVAAGLSRPYFFRSAGVGARRRRSTSSAPSAGGRSALRRSRSRRAPRSGFVIFQSAPSFASASVLPPAVDVDAVDLVALELQQRLVAQIERRPVERRFLERRNQEDLLLVVALGEQIARRSATSRR